jgi:putative ABC transport system permease protein
VYPNLLIPLLVLVATCGLGVTLVGLRQPISRRLALRQVARRRTEAALVITGSVLGTAIIIGALVVGDTLNHSVRQEAYRTLGPIDELVLSANSAVGSAAAESLAGLTRDPAVDGVLTARVDQAATLVDSAASGRAEPRVLAWDVDFAAAARFGRAGGDPGLTGGNPAPGTVVINDALAQSLRVTRGGTVTLFLDGAPHRYAVARVLPQRGLAGTGLGSTVNRNVFLPPGTLAQSGGSRYARTLTWISNRGGVESGNALTDAVVAKIRAALGPLASRVTVETPKHTVLANAKQTGDALGALFLMIGSFSIIAGALLLVNIFVMLADERKSQLGMLRAIGMKRSRLVGALTLEGTAYAIASILPGILLGVGVGYGVAKIAAQIFSTWSQDGTGLAISFAVSWVSLVNGVALGFVFAIATIFTTSLRICRFNIISAIRDLPAAGSGRHRRALLVAGGALATLAALLAAPALATSAPVPTLLLPSLVALFLVPLMSRRMSPRAAASSAATAVLAWSLVAPVVRPRIFDTPSMAVYVVSGVLVAFSGVVLVSQNQQFVLYPVRRLLERSSETGLAVRLAVAYPLAKRFRTGATLVMYTLITLVLVLLAEISGMINKSVDRQVADATAGYALRLDLNPATAAATLSDLTSGSFRQQVTAVTPLTSAVATATDPGHRTAAQLRALVVGVPPGALQSMRFDRRLDSLTSDRAVWTLLARDSRYVVLDQMFGATGGPNGRFYEPGDTFTVTNTYTGQRSTKTIAAVLKSGLAFYAASGEATNAYPIVTATRTVRELFGPAAQVSSAFVQTPQGTDPDRLAPQLQARYLSSSLVVTPIAANVRRMFAANVAFFRLMQGFLALGLLVGVVGLGVVMVRAVRERRRTIGVLRALGFRARTVARSFLIESGLVALEGILLGVVLGVLTTWLMYQKSAAFDGVRSGFPIVWGTIALLTFATLVASLLATVGPARRAAGIKPAIAVRVAD